MSPGKTASQAGHAYLGAFLKAHPVLQQAYHAEGIGTKVCLKAESLEALQKLYAQALALGIPCSYIEDSGRNTCFQGVTVPTAVGIGPVTKDQAPFLKRYQLLQ